MGKTKSKHTPGPWRTRKEKWSLLVCDEYGNQIALIRSVKRYGVNGDDQANARLIAAAPEMLEALQFALIELKAEWGNPANAITMIESILSRIEAEEEGR